MTNSTPLAPLISLLSNAKHIADSVLFTRFDDTQRTPLIGEDGEEKEDMIDFINSSMDNQIIDVLKVFTDIELSPSTIAFIEDIFEEGFVVRYLDKRDSSDQTGLEQKSTQTNNNGVIEKSKRRLTNNNINDADSKRVFIPFRTKNGNPYQRLYMLGAEAQIKLGIFDDVIAMVMPSSADKNDWTVVKTDYVSKNMLRIYVKSDKPLPKNEPGYAYRFALSKTDNSKKYTTADIFSLPIDIWQKVEPNLTKLPYMSSMIHQTKKYGLLTAFEVFKRIPERQLTETAESEQEQTKKSSATQDNKDQKSKKVRLIDEKRYYTLRQLKSNTNEYLGEVDIYIHDNTPGSMWAKSLQAGDTVKIDSHYHETIKEMTVGQPLFICDETSMPTVAAMLEQWQVDIVPIVINITNDNADFDYFDDMVLPDGLKDKLQIQHINTSTTENLANSVIEIIKMQNKKIDCAWGAIGKADFKPIKKYLRDEHELKGKLNIVRAYWR